jgi:hypothetical protein
MEFKGTKGKWEVSEINISDYKSLAVFSSDTKKVLLHVYLPKNQITEEEKANAQLISCAPEMLEMLKKLSTNYSLTPSERQNIKDVIKKATEI